MKQNLPQTNDKQLTVTAIGHACQLVVQLPCNISIAICKLTYDIMAPFNGSFTDMVMAAQQYGSLFYRLIARSCEHKPRIIMTIVDRQEDGNNDFMQFAIVYFAFLNKLFFFFEK